MLKQLLMTFLCLLVLINLYLLMRIFSHSNKALENFIEGSCTLDRCRNMNTINTLRGKVSALEKPTTTLYDKIEKAIGRKDKVKSEADGILKRT